MSSLQQQQQQQYDGKCIVVGNSAAAYRQSWRVAVAVVQCNLCGSSRQGSSTSCTCPCSGACNSMIATTPPAPTVTVAATPPATPPISVTYYILPPPPAAAAAAAAATTAVWLCVCPSRCLSTLRGTCGPSLTPPPPLTATS